MVGIGHERIDWKSAKMAQKKQDGRRLSRWQGEHTDKRKAVVFKRKEGERAWT